MFDGDSSIGEVTRGVASPTLGEPIALALLEYGFEGDSVTVRVEGEEREASAETLPFVEGSDRSGRLPAYE